MSSVGNRVRIDPFDEEQQNRYFDQQDAAKRRIGDAWLGMVADRQAMSELLGLPMVLAMIRILHDEAVRKGKPLPVFYNLSQLALVTARQLLSRALEKNSVAIASELATENISPPSITEEEKLERLEHVLTSIAFQLMLMEQWDGRLEGRRQVSQLREAAYLRFKRGVQKVESLNESDIKQRWTWAIKVLETIELKHRSVTERHRDDGIAFRSRKMMECHAARYLTRYATEEDIFGDGDEKNVLTYKPSPRAKVPEHLCAWNSTTHPEWKQTWQLAIEMPREPINNDPDGLIADAVIDPYVTCLALSSLFRLPKAYPERDLRPTELMYRAWPLFEVDEFRLKDHRFPVDGLSSDTGRRLATGVELAEDFGMAALLERGQKLLLGACGDQDAVDARIRAMAEFRETSRDLVAEFERRLDRVWIDEAPCEIPSDNTTRAELLKKWREQPSEVKSHTFLQCPPQSWIDDFLDPKGGRKEDPRVNPAIEDHSQVAFGPIHYQATAVTRNMYHQFDPKFAESRVKSDWPGESVAEGLKSVASPFEDEQQEADFPVIDVNWFDGWVFSRWLGTDYRLPIDFEWEFCLSCGNFDKVSLWKWTQRRQRQL